MQIGPRHSFECNQCLVETPQRFLRHSLAGLTSISAKSDNRQWTIGPESQGAEPGAVQVPSIASAPCAVPLVSAHGL